VGEAVEPSDPADISIKIESLAQRLEQMRAACVEQVRRFSWPEISRTYVGLYCEAGSLAA
jgi:glycosyltransferase involved in cell wall biosynthesis